MIVKVLGLLDILVAIAFWIYGVFNFNAMNPFILVLGMFLLIKGLIFAFNLNVASILDIISSFIIIYASSNEISNIIIIIVSIFLLQKGIFSLLN